MKVNDKGEDGGDEGEGYVVIGGMMAATVIAIFIIPALFYLVERIANGRRLQKTTPDLITDDTPE